MMRHEWENKLRSDLPYPKQRLAANMKRVEERLRMEKGKRSPIQRMVLSGAAAVFLLIFGIIYRDAVVQGWNQLKDVMSDKPTLAVKPEDGETRKVKLLLLGNDDDRAFQQQYGRFLMLKHPEWDIEIKALIVNPSKLDSTLPELLEQEKPDVIKTGGFYADWLIDHQALTALDPLIKKDRYDLENVHSGAIQPLRAKGGGKLFALPVTMMSAALIYNQDLFDRYQIPYPKAGLTWDHMLELARRFPAAAGKTGDVFGFQTKYEGYAAVSDIAAGAGLDIISNGKVDVHSGSWKKTWSTFLDGYPGGVFSGPPTMQGPYQMTDYLKKHPFMTGKTAMMINYTSYVSTSLLPYLKDFAKYGLSSFKWGIMPVPVSSDAPGVSRLYRPLDTFAVSNSASDPETAWKVVRYVTGHEMAQLYYKSSYQQLLGTTSTILPARADVAIAQDPEHLKPFYELQPAKSVGNPAFDPNDPFYRSFTGIATSEFQRTLDGSQTLEQMMANIERLGQVELDKGGAQ